MSKELVTTDGKSMTIAPELLAKIRRRNQRMTAFAPGEDLTLTVTGRTEEVDGQEFPVINLGDGKDVNLNTLGNFLISDDNLKVVNEGTPEECLDFQNQPRLLLDYMQENGGKLPLNLKVAARVKNSASQKFLEGPKGEGRKTGYKLLGLDTSKDQFPAIWLRNGADESKKENWRVQERVAVTVE